MDIQENWRQDLRDLGDTLLTLAARPPSKAMTGLSELIDYASPTGGLIPRLRKIRSAAAAHAVDLAGSQAEVARQEGLSRMAVSYALRAPRPHASRDSREAPAGTPTPAGKRLGKAAQKKAVRKP
jgi:hypothetical protein